MNKVKNHIGSEAMLISVKTNTSPFSFFLRDVSKNLPIYIPDYSAAVLRASDNRSYDEVQLDIANAYNFVNKTGKWKCVHESRITAFFRRFDK